MIAKAESISHGSISIDYITRMGKAEIVKLNHLPKDVDVEAWWAHMQAHQMKFRHKRSKNRPMKNFMIRIEISPAREETEGFTHADWEKLADDFIKAFDAIDLSKIADRKSASHTNIANSQYVVSLHRDSKSGIVHMHLDCNRIDMDGNVNDDHYIGRRATMAANEVTRQRGWVQAEQRSEENKERITQDCMDTLRAISVFSWEVYTRRLSTKGYDLQLRWDSNGEVRGYTVRMGNSIYKSSELGKGRNLVPSKIEATWRKLHPGIPSHTYNHYGKGGKTGIASVTQPKPIPKAEPQINYLREIDVEGHTYSIEIPDKAYDAMKDEIAGFKVDNGIAEHITNVALLLFASYIDIATSLSESIGGGGTSPSSGWGKNDDEDWEWARRCALMAHSMVMNPKPKVKRSHGR
ncbi:MAG: relaxase/mobilization nuclease domain-containing protein [Prevotella sp.]|nr:relaxase/mobilization nuclease domain-containing protein [Prevotella sp.]